MSTQPLHDANEQTGIDMSNARASSTVVVENVRDFLHRKFGSCSILPHIIIIIDLPPSVDGRDEWLAHSRIVNILQNDPVFDKSQRYCIVLQLNDQITDPLCREFLGRTEKYERGLALTNRIYELQVNHGWSEQQTKLAFSVLDESLSISLHNVGESNITNTFLYVSLKFLPDQHSNPSSCSKLDPPS